jgi:sarcosine oxidase subunit alpha
VSDFRLPRGGRLDRARRLCFTFDGRGYEGLKGDMLASALLANGVHLVGRSFKYHRPRGILSAGAEEPNALVGVGRHEARYTPNLRATQIELHDGLVAVSQNRFPSLRFDLGAINDRLSHFFPAGFYYKTFMWPRAAWQQLYEPFIRAAAGLGRAPREADADRYSQLYAHCDLLVVGAGPAGIAAALAAAESGARIILCDEQAEMGGSLLAEMAATIDGKSAAAWIADALASLAARDNVTLLPRTTAFGYYPHNLVGLAERVTDHLAAPEPDWPRERLWQVRAREVILAAGAIERPLVFSGNDRPGVMLADAARTYVNRYAVKPGARAVVFTAHDAAYRAALDLAAAGVEIAAIADLRPHVEGPWIAAAKAAGIDVRCGTIVSATRGRLRIAAAALSPRAGDGMAGAGAAADWIGCDHLLMSGGLTPSVHLFSQSRGKLVYDEALQAYLPGAPAERVRSAGACRGVFALGAAIADGYAQGEAAAKAAGFVPAGRAKPSVSARDALAGGFVGAVPGAATGKAFVDFQNDVTAKDVRLATQEGFRSIEHVKRYTTTGMATDQGKTANMHALGIVADALGAPVPQVGLTTFRPPYTPVTFGAFAGAGRGALFDPVRTTPMHDWAQANGAVFEDVGPWKRARYFPQERETMPAAVMRECRAVRERVGIFDASTLGKIEVVGADAAEFLNRIYVNDLKNLTPGRLRYGVMLREDGFVMDDGVVGRLAPDRFHVTTTTGGAARVLHMMEDYLQTEWPALDVFLTSTTEQWAVIAVQGPKAREVLTPLVDGVDISPAAMPHMSVREGRIGGVPMRLFRVSFTGECGYEVNVPADYGRAVWEAIIEAGRPFAITPYGTEAMHVLRAEKGYIIVGQEADGTATPDDLGLAWAIGKAKADFVGKRALARAGMMAAGRKQLVGLLTDDPNIVLEEGAQIVATPDEPVPMTLLGHVTSSYRSATLGRSIALAMLRDGRARIGERLFVPMQGRVIGVKVVSPVFYDPQGERLHG